jgi:hypothetical protein
MDLLPSLSKIPCCIFGIAIFQSSHATLPVRRLNSSGLIDLVFCITQPEKIPEVHIKSIELFLLLLMRQ